LYDRKPRAGRIEYSGRKTAMKYTIGIDLGTTNSAAAICNPEAFGPLPRVLQNRDNTDTMPSVIAFDDGTKIFGDEACALKAVGTPVASLFKRVIGDPNYSFEVDGQSYNASELSSLLLGALKDDASKALDRDIESAVITVPAYFRDHERRATTEAGRMAGLNVLQTINEPTAAAIAYGMGLDAAQRKVLIYDLGGGTFDVTVMDIGAQDIRILSSSGDNRLGGKDWDDWVALYLSSQFETEFGFDPMERFETALDLELRSEHIKKQLTARQSATAAFICEGERGRYTITRDQFETGTQALLTRTSVLTQSVLDDTGLRVDDIDDVVLVGGSTRMPCVSAMLTVMFGKPPRRDVNPDLAVAQGAAIMARNFIENSAPLSVPLPPRAAGLSLRKVTDVTNHSLGAISLNAQGNRYISAKILHKNQAIPCVDTRPFTMSLHTGQQTKMEIFLTQGETDNPADVSYIGLYVADNIPVSPGGKTVIDITYNYDLSGEVAVQGRVRGGAELSIKRLPLPDDVPARFLRPPPPAPKAEHLSVMLAVDLSGSMRGDPLDEAKSAANDFLTQLDFSQTSMGVMGVANKPKIYQKFSQDSLKVSKAIQGLDMDKAIGWGNLAHPFTEILKQMKHMKGRRFAIVLADGAWARQSVAIAAAKKCHNADIDIIAIGFGTADKAFLDAIASSDEGSIFTNQAGLGRVFGNIGQVLTETGSISGLRL